MARDHTALHHQYKQHNTYKKEHSTVNARIMPQVLLLACLLPHVLDAKPSKAGYQIKAKPAKQQWYLLSHISFSLSKKR
jgi:hypothetical protein